MINDAGQCVGEPVLRIDAVELAGFDEGIGDRRRLSAALRTHELIDFPTQGNGVAPGIVSGFLCTGVRALMMKFCFSRYRCRNKELSGE